MAITVIQSSSKKLHACEHLRFANRLDTLSPYNLEGMKHMFRMYYQLYKINIIYLLSIELYHTVTLYNMYP